MPNVRASLRRWCEPPRHLLLSLAAVTGAAAAAFGWLGWEMLRRDDAVEAQRRQERLEHAADRAIQAIERRLVVIDDRLAGWMSSPGQPLPVAEPGGVVAVLGHTDVQVDEPPLSGGPPGRTTRLLFRPVVTPTEEPSAAIFGDGEAAEFQLRDPGRAIGLFAALARSDDPALSAAALMRLGRVLRTSGRHREALAAYDRMAEHTGTRVVGVPADLVARHARLRVLSELHDGATAGGEARALLADLARVRWTLTRGQYEFYRHDAAAIAGVREQDDPEALAIATTIDELWREWQAGRRPARQRSVQIGGVSLLVTWRASTERAVAALVPLDPWLRQVVREQTAVVTLRDADGTHVAGVAPGPGREVIRMPADARLPWVVHVREGTSGGADPGMTRGRLTVVGIAIMSVFLVTGASLIGRAVRREMELSRLQTDFVSAVSHEFRTPLAAMRQLSEVLAAGRVPDQARQRQYFDALASESRRLQRLVETLLDFGRLQSGADAYQVQSLAPRMLIERVVAEYRGHVGAASCRIDVGGDETCGHMLGDPDALALALYNLLDNAVKYGGEDPRVDVSWTCDGRRIGLRVRDYGPGVPADERGRIFERFVRGRAAATTRVRGTGIGLALVKQIATGHGGEVVVETAVGTGSVFTIWIPRAGEVRT